MLKTFEVKLDIEKELYSPSQILFTVSRNDTESIELQFEITQDDAPFDLTGKIIELAIAKPSGLSVYQTVEITSALEGKASARLTIQAYVEFGIHSAEIHIRDADQMVVTNPFYFSSREAIMETEEIASINDWSALQQALFLYDKKPTLIEGVPTFIPDYAGQTALDIVNNNLFIATDVTETSWMQIGTSGGTTAVSWDTILNKPILFAPDVHTHAIADVNGLQTALDGKQDAGTGTGTNEPHTHAIADVTGLQTALDGKVDDAEMTGKANVNHSHTFASITEKPATYPPDAHTHTIANVTNLQTTLDGKAPTVHTHTIANVTNLQTSLDSKAPTVHTHAIGDVTNLQTTLNGKASTVHTHAIGDVTNLQASLDAKAPTVHTHTIANVNNLQTTLDGKADDVHTHAIADVTNLQATLDAKADDVDLNGLDEKPILGTGSPAIVPEYVGQMYLNQTTGETYIANGTTSGSWIILGSGSSGGTSVAWGSITGTLANQTDLNNALSGKSDSGHTHDFTTGITGKPATYPPEAHNHAIADVTGLQGALDGKADDIHTHAFADITAKPTTYPPDAHAHAYADITNKPTSFPPDAHNHAIADVTNLQSTLNGLDKKPIIGTVAPTTVVPEYVGQMYLNTTTQDAYISHGTTSGAWVFINEDVSIAWNEITGKPATFPPDAHAHAFADITGKPATYPPDVHTHNFASITEKPATYPPDVHTHAYADITAKPTSFPPSAHSHAIADVTNLQTTLDGKSNVGHVHTYASITEKPTSFPPDAHTHTKANITDFAHTHAIADVTNLQTSLDGKSNVGHTHTKANITDFAHTHTEADITFATKNAKTYVDDADNFILNTRMGGLTLKKLTQAEYDAIATKDPNTLYFIVG